jgi:hypothetical protein
MKKTIQACFIIIFGLLTVYASSAVVTAVLAAVMQFLFPAVIKIIDIPWPVWVISHAGKFTSWFTVLLTWRFIIGAIVPIKADVAKKE